MKTFFACFLISIASAVSAQDYPKLAKELQQKFKDDEAVLLESSYTYEFSRGGKSPAKVMVSRNEKLLSLRYNVPIYETEVYDANSQIEKFFAVSNLRQKAAEDMKACGTYTQEGLFFDDSKFCTHQLKLKEVGEVWDVTSVKNIFDARYLTTVFFQDKFPLQKKTISFIVPEEIEIEVREFNLREFSIVRKDRKEAGKTIIEFSAKDLPAKAIEDMDRGTQYNRPHVLVLLKSVTQAGKKTNVLASPQDLYAWYSSLTQQLKSNPAVFRPTVTQLIQDKKTDEEKIKAIYYWVQDNIRYIAFEDGVAAFKPSEAQDVFEKRYGDCKGMANLTKEMLKVAGYDARLTWIGTRRIMYDQTLPSLAVNNHMICTVLLNGKMYYLDATEKYMPFGENAQRIQSRSVMIEDGSRFILDKVKESDINHDIDQRKLVASINGENLEGTYHIDLKGEPKKNFLYTFNYTKSDKREDFITNFISSGNKNVKATGLKLPDFTERSGPLALDCNITFAGAVSSFNNEYYIDIDPSKSFKNWTIKDTRQSDVDFGEKIHKKTSIELIIPPGYKLSHLPEKVSVSDPEFSFAMQYTQAGNKIIYTKELNIPDGIIRKQSFTRWNDAVKKLAEAYESQIVLKK